MTVAELRAELKLSLEAFANRLGLKSKASAHEIETTGRASVSVALAIESLSDKRIDAATLNPQIAAIRQSEAA